MKKNSKLKSLKEDLLIFLGIAVGLLILYTGVKIPIYILENNWLLGLWYIPLIFILTMLRWYYNFTSVWQEAIGFILAYAIWAFTWFFGAPALICSLAPFEGVFSFMILHGLMIYFLWSVYD